MKNPLYLLVLLALLSQPSCTGVFPTQKIKFNNQDEKSIYYLNNDKIKFDGAVKIKKKTPFIITRMKEGYRTETEVRIAKQPDPFALATLGVFFAIGSPIFAALELAIPGGPFKHPTNIKLPSSDMTPLPASPFPNIYFETSNHFDSLVLDEALYFSFKKYRHFKEKGYNSSNINTSGTNYRHKRTEYQVSRLLNNLLDASKAQPDLPELVRAYDRNFNIDLRVENIAIVQVKHGKLERGFGKMVFLIRDKYEQVKDSLEYSVSSVWYKTSPGNVRFMFQTMMEDGISQLFSDDQFVQKIKQFQEKTAETVAAYPLLQFTSDQTGTNLESAVQAQITLKNESYLSSGFMISKEGHFITSYSSVTDLDSLLVVFPDGSSKKPHLERMDPVTNVALMKIDTTGFTTLIPSKKGTPALGSTLYAVGTPVNEWLDHSLTKGIVSSIRTIDGYEMIQTDTRSSYGNNGSPVLDSSGQLVGIMNNKLFFLTAQGLSMVVPISTVLERLKIQIN